MSRLTVGATLHYPVDMDVDAEWRDQALCRSPEVNPDLFFPERGRDAGKAAKAICKACPVSEPCLEYAVVRRQPGIWGGTSERERRKIRAALKADGLVV